MLAKRKRRLVCNMTLYILLQGILFITQILLSGSEYIPVRNGDLLGFHNDAKVGLIGFKYTSRAAYYTRSGDDVKVGTVANFEKINLPYMFAVAALFKPGM